MIERKYQRWQIVGCHDIQLPELWSKSLKERVQRNYANAQWHWKETVKAQCESEIGGHADLCLLVQTTLSRGIRFVWLMSYSLGVVRSSLDDV